MGVKNGYKQANRFACAVRNGFASGEDWESPSGWLTVVWHATPFQMTGHLDTSSLAFNTNPLTGIKKGHA
jgi:hypothetical protein